MLAVYYAVHSFQALLTGKHIRVLCDNTTAVSIVNKMGTTHNAHCNSIARDIWHFCSQNDIWLTCTYIPGLENVSADRMSRKDYTQAEWMLTPKYFNLAIKRFKFIPNLDCFATRLNTHLPRYVSYYPDPYAFAIDAFSLNWQNYKCYLFPPFSLISRVLQKIRVDKVVALCIFPEWPTQPWWPTMLRMTLAKPLRLKPSKTTLVLPNKPGEVHPMSKKLSLIACLLSGSITNHRAIVIA